MGWMFVLGLIDTLSGLAVTYLSLTNNMPGAVTFVGGLLLLKGALSMLWDM